MSERLDIGRAEEIDEKLTALKEKAREKIMETVEKFRDDPNIVINTEEETPEYIVLGIKVINPETKEFKTYRKGYMKVLRFPNGLSIGEEVEKDIRFPEEGIERP